MDHTRPVITRHELDRRHAALQDMQRYLVDQEREFNEKRRQVLAFSERYQSTLGPLYKELETLESQLRLTTRALISDLVSRGIEWRLPQTTPSGGARLPEAQMPRMAQLARLEGLPPATPLPPVPQGADISQWAPPTLKMLYRRAAMRVHPDRARSEAERVKREQLMMGVNAAYAAGERWRLEALLRAAGEDPVKISGGNAEALRNWIAHCEKLVQDRLRLVNDYLSALGNSATYKLWSSVAQAEARGLDPINTMAFKLRAQIVEKRKELYIGSRLKPESSLTRAFLHQRVGQMRASAAAGAARAA